MSRRLRRAPNRQSRGPRATLPPSPPRAPMPTALDIVIYGDGCEDCGHWIDDCRCDAADGPS